MSEAIGALRARVRLERPARAEDDLGGAAITWTDEGSVWAEIEAGGAAQSAALDTAPSVAAYRLTIRPREVRAAWRVIWGVRVFRVLGVSDDGAARSILSCEEEVL
jgi:head-tail adaptor